MPCVDVYELHVFVCYVFLIAQILRLSVKLKALVIQFLILIQSFKMFWIFGQKKSVIILCNFLFSKRWFVRKFCCKCELQLIISMFSFFFSSRSFWFTNSFHFFFLQALKKRYIFFFFIFTAIAVYEFETDKLAVPFYAPPKNGKEHNRNESLKKTKTKPKTNESLQQRNPIETSIKTKFYPFGSSCFMRYIKIY